MPQLLRGAVHALLGGSDDMDCGHGSLHDARVVVDDLEKRDQAVGGTGGIADNADNELSYFSWFTPITNMGGISRRDADYDLLGATLQMRPRLLHSGEDHSGLHNIFSTSITPFDFGEISLLEDGD